MLLKLLFEVYLILELLNKEKKSLRCFDKVSKGENKERKTVWRIASRHFHKKNLSIIFFSLCLSVRLRRVRTRAVSCTHIWATVSISELSKSTWKQTIHPEHQRTSLSACCLVIYVRWLLHASLRQKVPGSNPPWCFRLSEGRFSSSIMWRIKRVMPVMAH